MGHPIELILTEALEKLKSISDANTVVGQPITIPDGTVIIPISKVSIGFGVGGGDYAGIKEKGHFGGGTGAGVNVTPIAFLSIYQGEVSVLQLHDKNDSTMDKLVNLMPGIVDKLGGLMKQKGEAKEQAQEE